MVVGGKFAAILTQHLKCHTARKWSGESSAIHPRRLSVVPLIGKDNFGEV